MLALHYDWTNDDASGEIGTKGALAAPPASDPGVGMPSQSGGCSVTCVANLERRGRDGMATYKPRFAMDMLLPIQQLLSLALAWP